jgi:hypothetical protein
MPNISVCAAHYTRRESKKTDMSLPIYRKHKLDTNEICYLQFCKGTVKREMMEVINVVYPSLNIIDFHRGLTLRHTNKLKKQLKSQIMGKCKGTNSNT